MGNAGKSKLTTQLRNEHGIIAQELTLLRATIKQPRVEKNSNALFISKRLERLLTMHLAREERHLYPLLQRCLDSNVCTTLRLEHEKIIDLIQKAIGEIGEKFTRTKSIMQLDEVIRAHFSREENVLFWYLDMQLHR